VVIKNWEPLESGPEFASLVSVRCTELTPGEHSVPIDRMPSFVCFSLKFSSACAQERSQSHAHHTAARAICAAHRGT